MLQAGLMKEGEEVYTSAQGGQVNPAEGISPIVWHLPVGAGAPPYRLLPAGPDGAPGGPGGLGP